VAFASFYAEDASFKINDGEPSVGRAAIEQTTREFMTAFPDMLVRLVEVRREGDYVEFHWHWTGTHSGPGGTGSTVDLVGFEQWTIDDDGLILRTQGHMDDAEYQRQLAAGTKPCSDPWLQMVEQKLSTGDGQGHGPDLGSSEWRSVVEFKLGIRGNPEVPDRTTEEWCAYIDRAISRPVE
jgi:predicted SnoaL-like aldol condensation-catalyzing enzyme